ncbi:MAG TPA: DUF2232 domain-containing protein [Gemmatimonadaceae bacterium]|nr:DUF2232 domain-containing protein [Gemmatimonadaceae bacterium]
MTHPQPTVAPASASRPATSAPPGERGWGKLILGLVVFLILPSVPQLRALVPIDQPMLLLVPALAACALVGWWAGGRALLALAFVLLATLMTLQAPRTSDAFHNLARGWSLVLAGSFGLVCLFGARRPFFPRALTALVVSLGLALIMSAMGPVSGSHMTHAVTEELGRRNSESMTILNAMIQQYPQQWSWILSQRPELAEFPAQTERLLKMIADLGDSLYPSLLALESLAALAAAWAIYHRLARARLGPPLGPLREFRFNDQLVWGLIVGLVIVFLPTLASVRVVGRNLLVFFGALYALRGLGVLSWFTAPGALATTATIGFAMLWWPVLNAIAILGFLLLAVAAFGLGLGDTWADWRRRARSTT